MNWNLAVEKNHEALKRILAALVAMVGVAALGGSEPGSGARSATLPRHLHRFVLRLLRPAEAAARRLIIVAARGIVVKLPKVYERKPRPKEPPEIIYVLDRIDGRMVSVPMVVPEQQPSVEFPRQAASLPPRGRPLSLLDPMKRFGTRRRYGKANAMPQIRILGDDGPIVPFFHRPEPPLPSPDDPLDASRLHHRLDALVSALDDLPGQAMRMARWQARRNARLAEERAGDAQSPFRPFALESSPSLSFAPPSVLPDISPTRGEISDGTESADLPPRGGDVRQDRGGQRRALNYEPAAQRQTNASGKRRFHRLFPMRPGRPPGWRRKPNHDVYEVLNELHSLAVWASERRDSS